MDEKGGTRRGKWCWNERQKAVSAPKGLLRVLGDHSALVTGVRLPFLVESNGRLVKRFTTVKEGREGHREGSWAALAAGGPHSSL